MSTDSNLNPVPANLGGEAIDITPEAGDRGDDVVETPVAAAPAPVETPPAAETPPVEETPPAAETPPVEDAAAAPPAGQRSPIPYDRFKEVNEAKKAEKARADRLEAELIALKAGKAPAAEAAPPAAPATPAYDFGLKEREYAEMLLDGRTADAATLRAEINQQLLTQATSMVQQQSQQAAATTISQTKMREEIDNIAADYATKYPMLEDSHEDYREDVVADVQTLYAGALSRGVPPVKAFQDALAKAVKLAGLEPVGTAPAAAAAPTAAPPKKDIAGAAARAAAQPPPTSVAGKTSADGGAGELDIDNLTDEQMKALPPATLARLRGDFL